MPIKIKPEKSKAIKRTLSDRQYENANNIYEAAKETQPKKREIKAWNKKLDNKDS